MTLHFSTAGTLAVCLLTVACEAQERLARYAERFGSRELSGARAIDAIWPGASIAKVDELAFRCAWTARFGPEQELETLGRIFRRLQAIEYGVDAALAKSREDGALERVRPVPRNGTRPYAPLGPRAEALLTESEPNDTPAIANALGCTDQMQGALLGIEDRDVFALLVLAPARFVARVDPDPASATPLLDPTLELISEAGAALAFSDDANGTYPELDLLLPSGTWYFRVAALAPTMNGGYLFTPSCAAVPVLDASAPLAGSLSGHESTGFAVALAQDDALRLSATPLGAALLELELLDRDGLRVLATSRAGASSGEAAIRTALKAGMYLARVRELSGNATPFQALLAPAGSGIPVLSCSAGTQAIAVGGEANPAFLWQPGGIVAAGVLAKEAGWPNATRARIDDARGFALRTLDLDAESTGEIGAVIGPAALLGLGARNAGLPSVSWRDAAVARTWSRPQPSAGAYAGPTDLQVSAMQGFLFVDEHLGASSVLTVRLRTDYDVSTGGWDFALFVDRCFLEAEAPLGRMGFSPQAVRWLPGTQAGWASSAASGGPAELLADDDLYFAASLVDSSLEAREQCTLELDFDLTALGATGSQLRVLRFFAEWYFAGNGTVPSATSPPSLDDSSEESNVFARAVEVLRHGMGTWDALGDVMPFEDRVELTPSCHAIPQQAASAEDAALAQLDPSAALQSFAFSASSPVEIAAIAEPRSPAPWRSSTAAAAWRAPNAQHPGPIRRSSAGPFPAGVIGPLAELRLRVRWEACWDDAIWDTHQYYDFARVEIDAGAGLQSIAPRSLALGGDVARFRGPTGVTFSTGAIADLASDDGIYGRTRREDYDSAAHGASAEHWDELEFDLSPWLAPGSGAALLSLAAEIELYKNGAGTLAVPSNAGGSEELLLRSDLALEVYDFAAQTWIELTGAPAIRSYPFAAICAPVGTVDPEMLAFDLATGAPLGRDDDGGGGFASRIDLAVGDPATGRSDTLFVVGVSPHAGANERGAFALRIEAPFGYAGEAPFQLVLGSPFAVTQRGPDGWIAFGWHSYVPLLPFGVALGPPTTGWLVLDITGFFLALPNSQVIAGGTASGSLPTPADPSLAGGVVYGQGLLFDPATGLIHFGNEDRVVFVP